MGRGGRRHHGRRFGLRTLLRRDARRGAEPGSDVDKAKLEETVGAIEASGGKVRGVVSDVRKKEDSTQGPIEKAFKLEDRLDYVFANAGIGVFGETHLLEDEEWDRVIDINVWGVVHTVRPAYRLMVEQGFGHIVNTASLAGLVEGAVPRPLCALEARRRRPHQDDARRGPRRRACA